MADKDENKPDKWMSNMIKSTYVSSHTPRKRMSPSHHLQESKRTFSLVNQLN